MRRQGVLQKEKTGSPTEEDRESHIRRIHGIPQKDTTGSPTEGEDRAPHRRRIQGVTQKEKTRNRSHVDSEDGGSDQPKRGEVRTYELTNLRTYELTNLRTYELTNVYDVVILKGRHRH